MSLISATKTRTLIYDTVTTRLKPLGFKMLGEEGVLECAGKNVKQRITILSDVLTGSIRQHLICTANLTIDQNYDDQNDDSTHREGITGSSYFQIDGPHTRNIGYLLPQRCWKEWMIQLDTPQQPEIRNFADTIAQVGLPWLQQFETQQEPSTTQPSAIEHPIASYFSRSNRMLTE